MTHILLIVTGGDTGSQVHVVMVHPLLITVATGSRAQPAPQNSKIVVDYKFMSALYSVAKLGLKSQTQNTSGQQDVGLHTTLLTPLILMTGVTRATNSPGTCLK
jgi:Trm5-related predicted tRNA methylase